MKVWEIIDRIDRWLWDRSTRYINSKVAGKVNSYILTKYNDEYSLDPEAEGYYAEADASLLGKW